MFNGIITNQVTKVVLDKLTHRDTGSTMIGIIAAGLLSEHINFGDVVSNDPMKQATAIGLIVATVVQLVWGFYTGRKANGKT